MAGEFGVYRAKGDECTRTSWEAGSREPEAGNSGAASKCSISAVGTSTKLDPSALTYNRVTSPMTSRRSCWIEKPLRSTATSAAKQGSAAIANVTRTAKRSRNEMRIRIRNHKLAANDRIPDDRIVLDQRFRAQRQIHRRRDAARI